MKANLWRSLAAVLAGNLIYLLIEKHLPPLAQHQPFALDWGLVIDFWICLACFGLLRFMPRRRGR